MPPPRRPEVPARPPSRRSAARRPRPLSRRSAARRGAGSGAQGGRRRAPGHGRAGRALLLGGLALLVAALAAAAALTGAAILGAPESAVSLTRAAVAAPIGIPVSFERNVGQADRDVRFLAHAPGGALFLTSTEAVFALATPGAAPDVLRMRLLGTHGTAEPVGRALRPGTANYLVGDASRWRRGVPAYGRVAYRGVYRGIDLSYHAARGQLEYDFDVAPRADPRRIGLELRGARGLRIDARGRLVVRLAHRTLVQDAPRIYQLRGGVRRAVAGRYELRGPRRVGFSVGPYDGSAALVIDPTISWSTYLGGSASDVGTAIAVDRAGNSYVTGTTTSADLPLRRPLRAKHRGKPVDAFVAKLDRAGRLVYATYLGGDGYTDGRGIAVDRGGHAYVTGGTGSHDFPVKRAVQPDYGGGPFDAYVTKLSASGRAIVYSTFNGGPFNDRGYAIAVDGGGAAVATGRTAHDGFPGAGRIEPGPEGGAFVTKLAAGGRRVTYSTVLGGADPSNSSNTAFAVALDRDSNAYVTGITSAPDFPTVRPLQARYRGMRSNAFVTKIDARGTRIAYSTFLGGSTEDEGLGIAVDGSGSAYVAGHTSSADFPVAGPALPGVATGDGSSAFVAKLAAGGRALAYSVLLGGAGEDAANAIAVNRFGNAFVAGTTTARDFPATPGAVQSQLAGPSDAFVTALGRGGSSLLLSTYLGGAGAEIGLGLALDRAGDAYVSGQTGSPDFPILRPVQGAPAKLAATAGGGGSAFVTKISTHDEP